MTLIKLFLEFLKIGAFSFGGGLGTLPYIYEMARKTSWITEEYIGNILTISQVTPGPLACNIGTLVGLKVHGILGSFVANLAFIIPAICFMGVGYKILDKIKNNSKANEVIMIVRSGALVGLIVSSFSLFKSAFLLNGNIFNLKSIILCVGIYFLSRYKKINSIILMLISGIVGIVIGV